MVKLTPVVNKSHWFVTPFGIVHLLENKDRLKKIPSSSIINGGASILLTRKCLYAPLSSGMIGQPLSYWRKRLHCFHLLYKVKARKARGVILSSRSFTSCATHCTRPYSAYLYIEHSKDQ
jgi:hypothetical protein